MLPVLRQSRFVVRLGVNLGLLAVVLGVFFVGGSCLFFLPAATDADARGRGTVSDSARFYEAAYRTGGSVSEGLNYESFAAEAAEEHGIARRIATFVADYGLEHKRVLEVGSGRGYLQDAVADYTGLDISPTVAKYYRKPFVVGSATDLPFGDNSFDAVWSIWVLEHISQPERVLSEIRRVVKPGGVVYLFPAWNCSALAAGGFDVRPYSNFNWRGKAIKAVAPLHNPMMVTASPSIRLLRLLEYRLRGARTPFRFRALEPNYEKYWQADSDAVASLDRYEAILWFRARGDECENCPTAWNDFRDLWSPLIIRIKPRTADASQG